MAERSDQPLDVSRAAGGSGSKTMVTERGRRSVIAISIAGLVLGTEAAQGEIRKGHRPALFPPWDPDQCCRGSDGRPGPDTDPYFRPACDPRSVRKAARRGPGGSGRRVGGARGLRLREWTATNHPMCAGRFRRPGRTSTSCNPRCRSDPVSPGRFRGFLWRCHRTRTAIVRGDGTGSTSRPTANGQTRRRWREPRPATCWT